MDTKLFRDLATSLKQAAAISKGEIAPGRVTELRKKSAASKSKSESPTTPRKKEQSAVRNKPIQAKRTLRSTPSSARALDAKAIREMTGLSQTDFALVMNVSVATLRNWEQHRREPTGPAEALLRIVSRQPKMALKALHG